MVLFSVQNDYGFNYSFQSIPIKVLEELSEESDAYLADNQVNEIADEVLNYVKKKFEELNYLSTNMTMTSMQLKFLTEL